MHVMHERICVQMEMRWLLYISKGFAHEMKYGYISLFFFRI
jgi:hypothetical protein